MSTFYMVVFGESWEDVEYFSSFQKACAKLVIQSRNPANSFHPILLEYNREPSGGTYGRSKPIMGIAKLEELYRYDELALKENPTLAFHLVEIIF